jgi:drug/metabolite transporter (DMT)-like permease
MSKLHIKDSIMDKSSNKIYFFLCLAAILWGAQPVVVKAVLKELSPIMITFYRYIGISAILLIILFINNGKNILPPARHFSTLLLMGVTGITLNNVLQFSGLQYSTVINCTLVSATTPALTAVLSAIFLQEQMNAVQWGGIIISFFGVLYLVAHGSMRVIMSLSFNYGDIMFFGSQICWAIYSILGRKVMVEISPVATTAWAGLAGAIMTGILALWNGSDMTTSITSAGILSMSYIVIGGGVLAMTWWNNGVKEVGPSQASIFINIMPLVGMILAVIFLGEHLGWREIIGAMWIIFGVYLTTQNHQIAWWPKQFKIYGDSSHIKHG